MNKVISQAKRQFESKEPISLSDFKTSELLISSFSEEIDLAPIEFSDEFQKAVSKEIHLRVGRLEASL